MALAPSLRSRSVAAALRIGAGGPEQGAARRVSGRRDGVRPAGMDRRLFGLHQHGDLRPALQVRLSRAAVPDQSEHGGGAPDDLRGRAQLDDQAQAGHLLRRRSGVQGKEARARRRRLRLLVEADPRPQGPFAESPGVRPALRRRRRGSREGEGDGQVRLRRAHRGTARCRPLHAAAQADASGLQPSVRPHDHTHGSGRARSDRGLRRRELVDDGEPGRHRSLPLAGMAPRPEGRSGSESRLSQGAVSRKRRSRGQGDHGGDEGQTAAADRTRRDQHRRGEQSAPPELRKRSVRLSHDSRRSRRQRDRPR